MFRKPAIETVRVYRTMGQQFERFEDAITHRENMIDKFLTSTPGYYDIPLKSRTAFMASILERRRELIELLSYDDKPADEED